MHRNKRGVSQALSILILAAGLIFAQTGFAQNFTTFKLPGGVHHKTVYIDTPSYDAIASVCMTDKVSVKSWSGTSWGDWNQFGFFSTYGLDSYVNGSNVPYLMFSGDHIINVWKYVSGSWTECTTGDIQNYNVLKLTDFHVQDCVFYDDGNGVDIDNILICQTQMAEGTGNFGLHIWNSITGCQLQTKSEPLL